MHVTYVAGSALTKRALNVSDSVLCTLRTLSYFVLQVVFGLLLLMASTWDVHAVAYMTAIMHLTPSATTSAPNITVLAKNVL